MENSKYNKLTQSTNNKDRKSLTNIETMIRIYNKKNQPYFNLSIDAGYTSSNNYKAIAILSTEGRGYTFESAIASGGGYDKKSACIYSLLRALGFDFDGFSGGDGRDEILLNLIAKKHKATITTVSCL